MVRGVKIAGIKMCQAYHPRCGFNAICAMSTNLYGLGDNFDLETSHALPAPICKFHEAKESGTPTVAVRGTGTSRREFLHVDDLVDARWFLVQKYESEEIINVGVGEDVTIRELAGLVKQAVGYPGQIVLDIPPSPTVPGAARLVPGWARNTQVED